ncbi:universal stress protein [Pseudonocardia endophytica]|uniref:Nucleotide-binding universal stress UspA family protein n=1 Tax=Pseudonocardia endophytica TaxID=401976 RepID=A0A4R1HYT6_PSEEN|nr:universal stress protein [Pseudonocardia endophytica]TCK22742.1 nucleotide-binding universal stress UspA family protein [Pseudonocardia endophytica]
MTVHSEGPIVVGIDGSEEALKATRWAAGEALRRDRPVRLVAAVPWSSFRALGPLAMEADEPREAAFRVAREQIELAAAEAARTLPRDRVDGDVRDGRPATVLGAASEDASLLVVGDRGRGGFAGLVAGSVAVSVSATARCPVVVVRGVLGPDGAPVVVGVSDAADGVAALGFAFAQASERGAPLVAVRAWSDEVPGPAAGFLDRTELERNESAALREALAPWRRRFPAVAVREHLVVDRPAEALVTGSAGAQLLVVGSRGHGELVGTLLGSVSRAAVHHAHCPVAVVRAVEHGEEQK